MISRALGQAALSLLLVGIGAQDTAPLVYELTAAKGKVVQEGVGRLEPGAELSEGSQLATGWFSAAELEVAVRAARFEVGSRTRIRLAEGTPGVILSLDRGRLRALFDPWTGTEGEERRVVTPSAILAVRGTHYGVTVDGSGGTELVVFEGVVELIDPQEAQPPLVVEAGFAVRVKAGRAPGPVQPHRIEPGSWKRGAPPTSGSALRGTPPPQRPGRGPGG